MKQNFFALALIALLTLGCGGSKDLSQKKATEIIQEHYKFPVQVTTTLKTGYDCYKNFFNNTLKKRGVITTICTNSWFGKEYVVLTEEGWKYLYPENQLNEMTMATEYLTENVTVKAYMVNLESVAVSSNSKDKTAEALVQLKIYEVSPFGEVIENAKEQTLERKLFFKLYEDSWKLVKNDYSKNLLFTNWKPNPFSNQ